jgi:hypothetical protein
MSVFMLVIFFHVVFGTFGLVGRPLVKKLQEGSSCLICFLAKAMLHGLYTYFDARQAACCVSQSSTPQLLDNLRGRLYEWLALDEAILVLLRRHKQQLDVPWLQTEASQERAEQKRDFIMWQLSCIVLVGSVENVLEQFREGGWWFNFIAQEASLPKGCLHGFGHLWVVRVRIGLSPNIWTGYPRLNAVPIRVFLFFRILFAFVFRVLLAL